MVEMGCTRL
ncbi:rCG22749, partial [Rattus norvegicus]